MGRLRELLSAVPTGKPVTDLRVLVNDRRQNAAGEWENTEATRHRVTVFGTLAENTTESLRSGDRVLVVGRLTTDAWADKTTGDKRTATRVLADSVAVSLRWATATPTRTTRPTATPTGRAGRGGPPLSPLPVLRQQDGEVP